MSPLPPEVMISLANFISRLVDPLPLACCLYAGYAMQRLGPSLGVGVAVRLVFLGFTVFAARTKGQPVDVSALDAALAMVAGVLPVFVGRAVRKSLDKDHQASRERLASSQDPQA